MDAKQEAPKPDELRDSICREMFECGYSRLTDETERRIIDRRTEQVRSAMLKPKKPSRWSKLGNAVGEAIGAWFAGRQ